MKKYRVTQHACFRATERLGVTVEHASNHLNQLMQTAFYQGDLTHPDGKIRRAFDHYKSKTRLILGEDDEIITVYKFPEEEPKESPKDSHTDLFAEDVRLFIQRKFAKSEREYKRKERVLSIEIAELNLELATHQLSYAKAKSPKVRAGLSDKIAEVQAKVDRVKFELDTATKAFNEIKEKAAVYL
ncbi:hypothetical protein [Cytobacillus gottheilii]|uniref:Mobilization protein n=1 Tax=Cytobacillus gottheilii TaxID=859144 RepID=A0ABX8FG23_9BACI|nr:hypothetical protein [Cytobacillus gottheilii]QVY62952.1 hypothetical protein J1899_07885 [Cytobacillus gottheilii]